MSSEINLRPKSISFDTVKMTINGFTYTIPRTATSWAPSTDSPYPEGNRAYYLRFYDATGPADAPALALHSAQLDFTSVSGGKRDIRMRLRYRTASAADNTASAGDIFVVVVAGDHALPAVEQREVTVSQSDATAGEVPFPECSGFAFRAATWLRREAAVPGLSAGLEFDNDSSRTVEVTCSYDGGVGQMEIQSARQGAHQDSNRRRTTDRDVLLKHLHDYYHKVESAIGAPWIEWGAVEYQLPDGIEGVVLLSEKAVRGYGALNE